MPDALWQKKVKLTHMSCQTKLDVSLSWNQPLYKSTSISLAGQAVLAWQGQEQWPAPCVEPSGILGPHRRAGQCGRPALLTALLLPLEASPVAGAVWNFPVQLPLQAFISFLGAPATFLTLPVTGFRSPCRKVRVFLPASPQARSTGSRARAARSPQTAAGWWWLQHEFTFSVEMNWFASLVAQTYRVNSCCRLAGAEGGSAEEVPRLCVPCPWLFYPNGNLGIIRVVNF